MIRSHRTTTQIKKDIFEVQFSSALAVGLRLGKYSFLYGRAKLQLIRSKV
jgi:hypothetical protein